VRKDDDFPFRIEVLGDGFMAFPDHPTRPFLPMRTIARVFARR
jgi:hypothetical protein